MNVMKCPQCPGCEQDEDEAMTSLAPKMARKLIDVGVQANIGSPSLRSICPSCEEWDMLFRDPDGKSVV